MTRRPWVMIATGFAALALAGSAYADEALNDPPEVTIAAASATSGLYVRGDLGYAGLTGEGDPSLDLGDGHGGTDPVDFDEARFSRPVSATLGIGMKITDIIRADLTGEYFEGRFDGNGSGAAPCAGETQGTSCSAGARADYRALSLMANAYADFGTLAGFTPYLGAGLGATRMRFSDTALTLTCVDGAAACLDGTTGTSNSHGSADWRFTYAVMAGVSYDVTERIKLDLGYRYSDIAAGDMFGGGTSRSHDDGLQRHEVRAGVRVMLW